MLPVPSAGIGALKLPSLPPTPSGPNPTGPNSFGGVYDRMRTQEEAMRLPTQMEVTPFFTTPAPANDPEFGGKVDANGLLQPNTSAVPPVAAKPDHQIGAVPQSGLLSPFTNALSQVNALESDATKLQNEAAVGGDVDLHDVMIATEKANTALNFTVQLRNHVVDAYQEIMRMQV